MINKANPPEAAGRASPVWKKSYDELDMQKALAKQSQFPPGRQWARAGTTASATGGAYRDKQSQFPPDRPAAVARAQVPPHRGQARQTKPISPGALYGASIVWQKSYNESDLPGTWAKQSQFPGPGRRGGSGTDNCERSAAIRHPMPAPPRKPADGTFPCEPRRKTYNQRFLVENKR